MGKEQRRIIDICELSQPKITANDEEWRAAMLFVNKGPSATLQFLPERPKSLLYAYKSQALDGPCPTGQDASLAIDHALTLKQEAWKALGDMPKYQAKKEYVGLLSQVLPQWKEWHEEYSRSLHKVGANHVEEDDDGTPKIVKEFFQRNALRARL